jgi:hypothetical protein
MLDVYVPNGYVNLLPVELLIGQEGGGPSSCTATNRVKMGHLLRHDILTNRIPLYMGAVSTDK